MRDSANSRGKVTGQINDDKERDRKEENKPFSPQDMDKK